MASMEGSFSDNQDFWLGFQWALPAVSAAGQKVDFQKVIATLRLVASGDLTLRASPEEELQDLLSSGCTPAQAKTIVLLNRQQRQLDQMFDRKMAQQYIDILDFDPNKPTT